MLTTKRSHRKNVMERIKTHLEDGASWSEMANYFNSKKIFTVRGGKWYPQTLHRFYNTHKVKYDQ